MLIYFIFLFSLALLHIFMFSNAVNGNVLLTKRLNISYFWICVISLTLLMGLRAVTVGRDILSYQFRYNNYLYMIQALKYRSEFGFNYFNYFFNLLGVSWQMYLIITSAIISLTVLSFFKKYTNNLFLALFLYMTIGSFTMAMSGLRQTISSSFCLCSILFFDRFESEKRHVKKWLFSLVLWLLAVSFHNSALIFILFFALKIRKIRLTKLNVFIGISLTALSIFYGQYILRVLTFALPVKYANISLNETYNINPLIVIIAILIPLFCMIFLKTKEDNKYDEIQSLFFVFSMLNILFTCLSTNQSVLARLIYYFANANPVLIVNTIDDTSYKNRLIIKPVLIIVCLVFFYMGTNGGTLQIDDYRFFWSSI